MFQCIAENLLIYCKKAKHDAGPKHLQYVTENSVIHAQMHIVSSGPINVQ
jgi:hypothetical protein